MPRPLLAAAFLSAALPFAAQAQAGGSDVRNELLRHFGYSMSRAIALAEAMPADKYTWRPGAGVMPVAQVYAHIAHYNYRYPSTAMGVNAPAGVQLDTLERMTDKAQIVALLRQSADYVRTAITDMPAARLESTTTLYGRQVPQWAVLVQLVAHMNEHLGQSIAYARSVGVVPPWSR